MIETKLRPRAAGSATEVADKLIAKVRFRSGRTCAQAADGLCVDQTAARRAYAAYHRGVPHSTTLGASTAGEFIETGDAKSSACIFALTGDYRILPALVRRCEQVPNKASRRRSKACPARRLPASHGHSPARSAFGKQRGSDADHGSSTDGL